MKKYYYYIVIIALIASFITYLALKLMKPTYQSEGKVSVVLSPSDDGTVNNYSGIVLYNSVAEAIASRSFAKSLYDGAGVSYSDKDFESLDKVISAKVVENSDVIKIQLLSKNTDDLTRLGESFPKTIKNSSILKSQGLSIELNTIDPFYLMPNPVSVSPSKYAAIVFIATIIIGLLISYTFFLPEYNKFLSD